MTLDPLRSLPCVPRQFRPGAILLVALTVCSCSPAAPWWSAGSSLQPAAAVGVHALLAGRVDQAVGSFTPVERGELIRLYEGADPASLWVDDEGRPVGRADEALALLERAVEDGLDPASYDTGRLQAVAAQLRAAQPAQPADAAAFDLALSASLLRLGHDLSRGRVSPRDVGLRLSAPTDRRDVVMVLRRAIDTDRIAGVADELRPSLQEYRALRAELARYRVLAVQSPPEAARVRQIELALERLRWLPELGDRRLIVLNIPMFQLWAWDPWSEAPSLSLRAIVGRAGRTPTPVFAKELDAVIFRPYWNIPTSILRGEILPALAREPGFLDREAMEIVQGAGDNAQPVAITEENLALLKQGALRLRQRPGPENALGLIKFVFPNEEHVYLHDTPGKRLFNRPRRDFSHGCVRVEDPVALAEWVLEGEPEWTRERILAAAADAEHQSRVVRLRQPIRVILFYNTATVLPGSGEVHFAEDIYRHDRTLDRALSP
jgi:murein L,D-transpeptidase YcbB/YkuD